MKVITIRIPVPTLPLRLRRYALWTVLGLLHGTVVSGLWTGIHFGLFDYPVTWHEIANYSLSIFASCAWGYVLGRNAERYSQSQTFTIKDGE